MFDSIISDAAFLYDVPEAWIRAFIQVESNYDPSAFNPNDPGGAWGLMQIIADTAHRYGVTDLSTLFDPAVNIDVGTRLLRDLRQTYGASLEAVASAYNSGNPVLWQTDPLVAEYVSKIKAAVGVVIEGVGILAFGVFVWLVLQFRKRG